MTDTGPGEVIDLRERGFRPDMAALARSQIAEARERLGLTYEEFAEVLRPVLGWSPKPDLVECWESEVTPPGDVLIAVGVVSQASAAELVDRERPDLVTQLIGRRYADVEAVFPTRSEFTSYLSPQALFTDAKHIEAAGLSLNTICQQYPDDDLRCLIEAGTELRCLFLAPFGKAIQAREHEEDYDPGHLSRLTELNISILTQRVRKRLPDEARHRLRIATYDEPIRFNVMLFDRRLAVVQPYLYGARGVESPTFLLRRQHGMTGMFQTFEHTFDWLWERRTEQ